MSKNPRSQQEPGGTGAVLGVRLMRYAGVQGASLLLSNLIQLMSVAVVAHYLGPASLGQYSLLLFLSGIVTQVFVVFSKSGTIRRTFGGGGDDDDDDDEDDTMVSSSPERSLGTGLLWTLVLGFSGAGLMILFARPISSALIGSPENSIFVVWAAAAVAFGTSCKLTSISLWLERRPTAFLIADAARPTISLIALAILLATGSGIEGAIASTAFGAAGGTLVGIFLLRGSFELGFDPREVFEIAKQGRRRAPVVFPFWVIQNADVFILSRVVSHEELGIYALASKLGFVVSFLPQGFRMAMRPLRKSAIFKAVREEYGQDTQRGQLLGYFTLLCIFSVLSMVMLGKVLVEVAPPAYSSASSLIPFTAGAMVAPAMYRTVNQNTTVARGRLVFVSGCLIAAVLFCGLTYLLAPVIGTYAAPISMMIGFGLPASYMFIKTQTGPRPIAFPTREVATGFVLAVVVAASYLAIPDVSKWADLAIALAFLVIYTVGLVVLRVIPENHWYPLAHMVRSSIRGTTIRNFKPRAGICSLEKDERKLLRRAVKQRMSASALRDGEGAELVGLLRRVGTKAGVPGIDETTEHDQEISVFLFERAPTAVRNASMRRLLDRDASSTDLRALEDLVESLRKVPNEAWKGAAGDEGRSGGVRSRLKRA